MCAPWSRLRDCIFWTKGKCLVFCRLALAGTAERPAVPNFRPAADFLRMCFVASLTSEVVGRRFQLPGFTACAEYHKTAGFRRSR